MRFEISPLRCACIWLASRCAFKLRACVCVWVSICAYRGVAAAAAAAATADTTTSLYSLHHRHRIFARRWDQWKCVLENSWMLPNTYGTWGWRIKAGQNTIPSWMVMAMMFCCCVCIISNYARCCSFTSEPLYFNCVAFSKFFSALFASLCCLNPIRSDRIREKICTQMR